MKTNSPFTKLLRTSAIGFFISAGASVLMTFLPLLSIMWLNTLLSGFIGFFVAGILLDKEAPKKLVAVTAIVAGGLSALIQMVINALLLGGGSFSFGFLARFVLQFNLWNQTHYTLALVAFFIVSVYAVFLPCNYVLSGHINGTIGAKAKRFTLIGVAILLISAILLVLFSDSNKTAEEKWKEQMTDMLEEYSEYKGGFY